MQSKELGNDHNSSLLLKPPPDLELLVNQFNNARITKQVPLLNNFNLNKYSLEFTPTETFGGGTLLSIRNSPWQSANVEAFAKAYICFLVSASTKKMLRQLNS